MASVLKKAGLGVLVLMGLLAILSTGMVLILRYQPKPLVNATRKVFGRVLNPVWMWLSHRFDLDTAVVYHVGRKSGREYATPLCMVSTPEGFIVPAACGPDVDWLANLKANPESKVTYNRATHPTVAEAIDLEQAVHYAGGTPGCDCWTQFGVEELVLLRPVI
jgi:deazaflavin-dependent oxidoreductase (nitroreductase family)